MLTLLISLILKLIQLLKYYITENNDTLRLTPVLILLKILKIYLTSTNLHRNYSPSKLIFQKNIKKLIRISHYSLVNVLRS